MNVTFEVYQPAAGLADLTSGQGFLFVYFFQTYLQSTGWKDGGFNDNHPARIWCAISSLVFGHALGLPLSSTGTV